MSRGLKHAVKSISNIHRADGRPNVLLFSTPRSGSTWLMELIWTQPSFKYCNQPLSLFNPLVRKHLGLDRWEALYESDSIPTLERYFRELCEGRLRFTNPSPLRGHYRPITHRIVFKEIHGCADRINWFRDTFNARIAYLIRHPIAVAISSEQFPMLDAFLGTAYRDHFSHEQLGFADRIVTSGSPLEQGVLSWCLQNSVPLREASDDWAVVTYEQLVVDPAPVIHELAAKLELPAPDRMRDALTVPSVNVKIKSSEETQHLLYETKSDRRPDLVNKWRRKIGASEEARAMEILSTFKLDVYRRGDVFPADWAWIPGGPALEGRRTDAISS
jgi:sulfotransferase family protein